MNIVESGVQSGSRYFLLIMQAVVVFIVLLLAIFLLQNGYLVVTCILVAWAVVSSVATIYWLYSRR